MLVRCSLVIQDLDISQSNARPLVSCVTIKKVYGNYYLCVHNAMYPNIKYLNLAMLTKVYHQSVAEGKIGLEFKEPKKLLSIDSENKSEIFMLYTQIKSIVDGKNVNMTTCKMPNGFDQTALEFVAVERFDNSLLNTRYLTILMLEKCNLPTITIEIGHLPIKNLSIAGSILPTNQDAFWNWTSITTICNTLTDLKLDSIGMKSLPFEIMFLKNLEVLSARNNKLVCLPHFVGGLGKLKTLLLSNNLLLYLSTSSFGESVENLEIINNLIYVPDDDPYIHIRQYLTFPNFLKIETTEHAVKSLSHLALNTFMDNCIPFKRQDIPRKLWIYFNIIGRCIVCKKWILPNYSKIEYSISRSRLLNVGQTYGYGKVKQSVSCKFPNNCNRQF